MDVTASVSTPFPFIANDYSIVHTYHIVFTRSSGDRLNAALTFMSRFLCEHVLPRCRIARSFGNSVYV